MTLVPSKSLLRIAVATFALALFASISTRAARLLPWAGALIALAAAADALISRRMLREIEIAPASPADARPRAIVSDPRDVPAPLVRLVQGRCATVAFKVMQSRAQARRLRIAMTAAGENAIGLEIGVAVAPAAAGADVGLLLSLPATEISRFELPFTARARGRSFGLRLGIESASRLQLWSVRERRLLNAETRVYADTQRGRRAVLTSNLYRAVSGAHLRRQTGHGRDFERLREYMPGDSYQDVSWKATARRAFPVTRVYQWESLQEVYLAVDHSRLSALAAGDRSMLDVYVETALTAGSTALELGDRFGLITFSEDVTGFVRAGSGRTHFGLCRETLVGLQPRRATPEFAALFARIRATVRKRAMILVLTDLSERALAEDFLRGAEAVRHLHLVAAQTRLPEDAAPLFGETAARRPPVRDLDEIYARLAGARELQRLRELRRVFALRGMTFGYPAEQDFLRCGVEIYLDAKRSQRL
jgi:uncharacterized protein (DUF58 family)